MSAPPDEAPPAAEPEKASLPVEPEGASHPAEPGDAGHPAEPENAVDPAEPEDASLPAEPEDAAGPAEPGGAEVHAGAAPAAPEAPPVTGEAVRLAEALLFASDRPVTAARLQQVLPEGQQAVAVLAALAEALQGRGVMLAEVAGGWALRTAPDLAPALTRVVEVPRRLPRVAMETLAVIAWHQPCTRAEVEEIRGAGLSQATLEALLEHGLIAPKGHKEVPGRPTLWGTTPRFLEQFGLASIRDLPKREELVSAEAAAPLLSAPMDPGEEAEAAEGGGEDPAGGGDSAGDPGDAAAAHSGPAR